MGRISQVMAGAMGGRRIGGDSVVSRLIFLRGAQIDQVSWCKDSNT